MLKEPFSQGSRIPPLIRIPLAAKFALPIVMAAVVFIIIAFTVFVPGIGRAFKEQEQDLGRFMPGAIASALEASGALGGAGVERLLEEETKLGKLAYALVLDAGGKPLASAGPLAGAVRENLKDLPTTDEPAISEIGDAEVIHFSAPIQHAKGGRVVVGWNRSTTLARFYGVVGQLTVIILVALVISIGGGAVYGWRVSLPLMALTRAANRIAETGDLGVELNTTSDDEIGQLGAAFAKMVTRQKEILVGLQDSVKLLSTAVASLTATAEEQSQTITKQAAALQEAQVTAQEIKETSAVAAQKAEAVLRVTDRADDLGRAGENALEQSQARFAQLREQVQQMAARITELGTRTEQVGSITQTVKDLADQSNMLALNAAIEAVRSGEHGKGFGVVAREIRSLADQSIQATNQVREILGDISSAISGVVGITEEGAKRMEAGLQQVRASGESLRELSGIVKESSAAVRQIAGAVSQQNAGIGQIFGAVTDLTRMMDETVKRLDTTNSSIATLKELSERVSSVVRAYRV